MFSPSNGPERGSFDVQNEDHYGTNTLNEVSLEHEASIMDYFHGVQISNAIFLGLSVLLVSGFLFIYFFVVSILF